jgi:hypothetical protein
MSHIKGPYTLRVGETRALKRLLASQMEKITVDWRKLHNEELCGLYALQNIVCIVKLRTSREERRRTRKDEEIGL